MKRIIIINGPPGAGKDTFVEAVGEELGHKINLFNFSTVDNIKRAALLHFGWDGKKDEAGRLLLHELKNSWTKYNNGPFTTICKKVNAIHQLGENVIFIHSREIDEISNLALYFPKAITLFIQREGLEKFNNPSDSPTPSLKYNVIIDNNGSLDDLRNSVRDFIKTHIYNED